MHVHQSKGERHEGRWAAPRTYYEPRSNAPPLAANDPSMVARMPRNVLLLSGTPATNSQSREQTTYGDDSQIPYVGIGFICRYMSAGVTSYVPVILNKCRAQFGGLEAATQEEDIEWQTQEIEFNVMLDDSANHNWKMVGADVATEAVAEDKIKTYLNIQ